MLLSYADELSILLSSIMHTISFFIALLDCCPLSVWTHNNKNIYLCVPSISLPTHQGRRKENWAEILAGLHVLFVALSTTKNIKLQ